jgi:hypothetical protein
MKNFVWVVLLVLMAGCGRERIADIATPEEMDSKALLIILPSVPEEFCYADRLTEIMDDFSVELNGTNPQVLSMQSNLDCSDYGFSNCARVDLGTGSDNKPTAMIECLSDDQSRICLFLLGNEYRDVEGNTFDETCVEGIDRKE